MSDATERLARLDELLAERDVEMLLVTGAANLRYLTGFTGSSGIAAVATRGRRAFFTDFRYETMSAEQVDAAFEREIGRSELFEDFARWLETAGDAGGLRLGFEDDHLTVRRHALLRELLPVAVELVAAGGAVEDLRIVKDAGELRRIADAAALIDEVLETVAERGLVGRTEREVAIELEGEMRRRGATGPSFATIVAGGAHGALPHAVPRETPIEADTLVVIDLGAELDGYCSDCTRTFATGELDGEQRDVYELVLRAQLAGLDAVAAGPSGSEVDAAARGVIEAAGYGERFGHGLGHGVGIEVHEAPRLARAGGTRALEAGNVVTVEPGVYVPGRFGVRIEDLVAVTPDGCDILSRFPKELVTVG